MEFSGVSDGDDEWSLATSTDKSWIDQWIDALPDPPHHQKPDMTDTAPAHQKPDDSFDDVSPMFLIMIFQLSCSSYC